MSFGDMFMQFFTHKDFLPSPDRIPGTLFTPLHFLFAGFFLIFMLVYAFKLAKQDERTIRTVFTVLWITLTVLEIIKHGGNTGSARGFVETNVNYSLLKEEL